MIITNNKIELRKHAMQLRKSIAISGSLKSKSSIIVQKILNSDDFKNAKNIAIYYPIKNEIDITGLFNYPNKKFYLPRCKDNELEFVEFKGFEELILGEFGILIPDGEKINPEILDVIYVPALMANTNHYRLGYGRGFYDRFFAKHNLKAKKIIIIANELLSNDFIQEENDIQCDTTISA